MSEVLRERRSGDRQRILPYTINLGGVEYIRWPLDGSDMDWRLYRREPIDYVYKETLRDESPRLKERIYRGAQSDKDILLDKLHIDKTILTPDELADVIKEGLKLNENTESTNKQFVKEIIEGRPQSIFAKLIDIFGQAVYGQNNYIGPEKSGLLRDTRENIYTSVPALSEEDARARAHDIIVDLTDNPDADKVLSGVARQAAGLGREVYRIINPKEINPYRSTNKDLLALAGDVEENPGPQRKYEDDTTVEALKVVLDNPVNSTSYLNANNTNDYIDEQVYSLIPGQFALRSGLDNQTDHIQMDTNWIEVSGNHFRLVAPPAVAASFVSERYSHYAIRNNHQKSKLENGSLGTGLASALVNGQDFLAAERTNANLVSGDANLGIFTRAVACDYGMYLGCAKLLCYESNKQLLSGQAVDFVTMDRIYRTVPSLLPLAAVSFYPLSENVALAGTVINAYLLDPQLYANMLRGTLDWPAGNPSEQRIAVIMVPAGIDEKTLTYITICHMEYPFVDIRQGGGEEMTLSAGNGVPINTLDVTPGIFAISQNTLIDGPKFTVYYVSACLNVASIIVNTIPVARYNPVAPVAVNIANDLASYWNLDWRVSDVTTEYASTLDYFLRFMDIKDWFAACSLAGSIIRWKMPYDTDQVVGGGANNTRPLFFNGSPGTINPTLDGSISTSQYGTVANINTGLATAIDQSRQVTCYGFPTMGQYQRPVLGTNFPGITINAYVQDASHTTYYAVHTKMLAKKVLAGSTFLEVSRLRFRKVLYMIRNLTDIIAQCAHNFFQDMGIMHTDLDMTTSPVQDLRLMIYQGLHDNMTLQQTQLAGFPFLDIPLPYPDDLGPLANITVGTVKVFDVDAYRTSNIILYNHLELIAESKWYYGDWEPMPTFNIQPMSMKAGKWIPDVSANFTAAGVTVQGGGRIRLSTGSVFGANEDEGMRQVVREMYAAYVTSVYHNPGARTRSFDAVMDYETGGVYVTIRNSLCYTKNFLRWSSQAATSDQYRSSGRGGFVISLPRYPPESHSINGSRLIPALMNQSVLSNLRAMYSLKAGGSFNFQFTLATRPPILNRLLKNKNKYDKQDPTSNVNEGKPTSPVSGEGIK